MEESERPSKIRKLSHEHIRDPQPEGGSSHVPETEDEAVNLNSVLENKSRDENAPALKGPPHSESLNENAAESQAQNGEAPALSKNQLKKLRKKEAWEAGRDDRKLKRKEKDKEKKARKRDAIREAIANGRENEVAKIQHPDRKPRPIRRVTLPVTFMLDCGFDEYMLERESISLGTQITRSYSEYMKSPYQPHLIVSGWTKKNVNRLRFEGLLRGMYKNWTGVVFTDEDFVGASLIAENNMKGKRGGRMVAAFEKYAPPKPVQQSNGHDGEDTTNAEVPESGAKAMQNSANGEKPENGSSNGTSQPTAILESSVTVSEHFKALQAEGEVIYLTSDSPDTLTELKPFHTYIIGGIVDKNRHKGLCYKRALNANSDSATGERLSGRKVKTAKLPIGEYMQMASRQVLATNHVVEIMLRWLECRDWGQAFMEVMPKRKGAKLKDETMNGSPDAPEDSEHDEDLDNGTAGDEAELAAHTSLENGDDEEQAAELVSEA